MLPLQVLAAHLELNQLYNIKNTTAPQAPWDSLSMVTAPRGAPQTQFLTTPYKEPSYDQTINVLSIRCIPACSFYLTPSTGIN